jgi:hypothetical protein
VFLPRLDPNLSGLLYDPGPSVESHLKIGLDGLDLKLVALEADMVKESPLSGE